MTTSVSARPVYIYALLDPRSDEVRYIGRAVDPRNRLGVHMAPSSLKAINHRTNWIRGLLAESLRPQMVVLECSTAALAQDAERRQIAVHRAAGCRLVNATDGGDGVPGHRHSAETRAKLSALRKGKPRSDETRAKLSAVMKGRKGRPLTDAQRAALRAANVGRTRVHTLETRAKIAAAAKGHKQAPLTPEQRTKQIAAQTGKPMTPEARARLLAANKGRVKSAEERARLSAALKGRPKSPEVLAKLRAGHAAWQQHRKEATGATCENQQPRSAHGRIT